MRLVNRWDLIFSLHLYIFLTRTFLFHSYAVLLILVGAACYHYFTAMRLVNRWDLIFIFD